MASIANANSLPRPPPPKLSPCCFNGQRIHHHGQTSSQSPRLAMAQLPAKPSAPDKPGAAPDRRAAVYHRLPVDRFRSVQPELGQFRRWCSWHPGWPGAAGPGP